MDAPAVNFTPELLASTPRISQEVNRLIFTDIQTSDDGLYTCYFRRDGQSNFQRSDSGCIYVLGKCTIFRVLYAEMPNMQCMLMAVVENVQAQPKDGYSLAHWSLFCALSSWLRFCSN